MTTPESPHDPRTPYQILSQDHGADLGIDAYKFLLSMGESEVLAQFGANLFYRSLGEDRRRIEAAKVPYRPIHDLSVAQTHNNDPIL